MYRLTATLVALGLLSACCVIPPIAYHDGLPAATPMPGTAAARMGYNRFFWHHDSSWERPGEYFFGGLRFGQDWRRFSFEEGLTVLLPGTVLPCLQAGVGLREPALTVRALWTPLAISSQVHFDPMLWWQLSALAGTPRNELGPGFSAGVRTSRLGIGPEALADFTLRDISFRLEGSMTFRTPWADSVVQGTVLTVGLTAEPSKAIVGK